MRALFLALPLSILTLFPSSGNAGQPRPRQLAAVSVNAWTKPNQETYRGYLIDLSQIAGRQDFAVMADALRHQIDIVETVGLSQRVLEKFHTIPIVVDELQCLPSDDPPVMASACYTHAAPDRSRRTSRQVSTVWNSEKHQWTNPDAIDLAVDTGLGVVMIRPLGMDAQAPVMLHELFHFYHDQILPQGYSNSAVLFYYDEAKSKHLHPADAYLMRNEREFFAVTTSVFLYGRANQEPFTRANLKQKQPDYFNYLAWLFLDPERAPNASPDRAPSAAPMASAD
jgi:hypothetical protein